MRRLVGVMGVAALLVASIQPVAAHTPNGYTKTPVDGGLTVGKTYTAAKTASGQLAQSDADLLARTDGQLVNVMVKVDVDPVASYAGGTRGFAATSPSVTGQPLKESGTAVTSYTHFVGSALGTAQRQTKKMVPAARVGRSFTIAYGGFAARIPANQAKSLLKVPGVVAVQYDPLNQPLANDSPIFVGATQVWPSLGGEKKAGMGVKVGVLDTGIWPENPMLVDPGIPNPGGTYDCDFGTSGETYDAAFTCNDKLIGAYAFLDTNILSTGYTPGQYCTAAGCTARDANGHGTHTSTTAAGSPVDHAVLLGIDRGHISGIAPGASLITYRVCDSDGCFGSDSIAAVQQAIEDGVDVINFSISGGANPYSDPVELAFLDAYAAGIEVNASAGNSGPDAATAEHGGPWVTTVGASTLNRSFESTVHLTANGGAKLNVDGATVTAAGISTPTPVVLAAASPYGDALCQTAATAGTFSGKVVVCKRGGNARIAKGYNVLQGNAAGMILYNAGPTDLETDSHFLPAIHVNDAAEKIKAFVNGHTNVMATWARGTAQPAKGDVMASFSSRGPVGEFIKPDVTAPGLQILAGESYQHAFDPDGGLGPNGENYQAIAGTSMSSPHATGVAALIKAAHPTWTPGEIKSAMMTSSVQSVVKENGKTPSDPFDRGAGSIRANRAVSPTVTFDVAFSDYYAAASDPFARINLNLPSIDAPNMPGMISTFRTVSNATNARQTLKVRVQSPRGGNITVTPSTITLNPWGKATFQVQIDGQKLADGQYFGQITLDPIKRGANNAVIPVAFYKTPGTVDLANDCLSSPSFNQGTITIARGDTVPCEVTVTNFSPAKAAVSLRVKATNTGRLIIKNPSTGNKMGNGFVWNGVLDAALPPPVIALDTPGDGWLDISDPQFGLSPLTGVTDESITNIGLAAGVRFGDTVYDTIGMVSNGYVVVGGGTSADVAFDPQNMPDPASPNNVLAPFWTDLNPSVAGAAMYAGGFYCGEGPATCGYMFEWKDVPVYGTSATRSFEVWMYTDAWLTYVGDSSSYITFEYDPANVDPGVAGTPLNIGAEDALGLTAAQTGIDNTGTLTPNAGGYFVVVDASQPGGSMSIDYDAFGKKTGNYDLKAFMTTSVTQGTAFRVNKVHVVNP